MDRPILLCTTLALLAGLSQFATPLAISAQGSATISARASVVDADASWEAFRTGQEVARAVASWAGQGAGSVAGAGEEGVRSVALARALRSERAPGPSETAVVVTEVGAPEGTADEARPSVPKAGAAQAVRAGEESRASVDGESLPTTRSVRITVSHIAY